MVGWANGRISLQVYCFYSRRSYRIFSVYFGGHCDEPISCRFVSISSKPKKHNSNYRNFCNLIWMSSFAIASPMLYAMHIQNVDGTLFVWRTGHHFLTTVFRKELHIGAPLLTLHWSTGGNSHLLFNHCFESLVTHRSRSHNRC